MFTRKGARQPKGLTILSCAVVLDQSGLGAARLSSTRTLLERAWTGMLVRAHGSKANNDDSLRPYALKS